MLSEQIEDLTNQSNEKLFELIGISMLGASLSASPSDDQVKQARGLGLTWYEGYRGRIKSAVCQSDFVRQYLDSERVKSRIEIIGALADLISPLITGLAGFSVAVLIFREGIETFCEQ